MSQPATPPYQPGDLERLNVFRGVEIARVQPLLQDCTARVLAPGEVLIHARQPNRYLYLLVDGELSVHLAGADTESVARLRPGESVGEISVIDRGPASAFVVAVSESRVLVLDEVLMWRLAELSHEVSVNLLHALAGRLRDGNDLLTRDRERLQVAQVQATVDGLTGLHNRHWLDAMMPRQMDRCRRDGAPLAVMMTDVDDFKRYNDTHGHVAGDCALQTVASALRECLRPADMAARYGGEEFLVLLPGADLEDVRGAAERVRHRISREAIWHLRGDRLPGVTVSVGAAEMTPDDTPERLVEVCDAALYRAKQSGRNRVCVQGALGRA